MASTDIRKNVLGIINEARKKFVLTSASTLTDDSEAELMVEILNDVIDEVSDYGDWKENIKEIMVTASSSVADYSIETSGLVKNVHELAFDDDISPMWLTTFDDILRLNRTKPCSCVFEKDKKRLIKQFNAIECFPWCASKRESWMIFDFSDIHLYKYADTEKDKAINRIAKNTIEKMEEYDTTCDCSIIKEREKRCLFPVIG